MSLSELILKIKPVIEQSPWIDSLWLEGSYATGEFNEHSDIDVWISANGDNYKEAFNVFEKSLKDMGVLRAVDTLKFYSNEPKLAKAKFYLTDKTDDQRIELDIQSSDRDFLFDHEKNKIVILFDKTGVIKYGQV